MCLTLPQRVLLVKLFYCHQSNATAAFRKGSLSINALKSMIHKFEETESLAVRSGRGRKPVSKETIADVATALLAGTQGIIVGSNTRGVPRQLDLSFSTVRKVLGNFSTSIHT